MKTIIISLFTMFPGIALANSPTTLLGVDAYGEECALTLTYGPDGNWVTANVGGYEIGGFHLKETEDGILYFEDTTMDYGDNRYYRVIGAPITISKVGLLEVDGRIQSENGVIRSYKLRAVGGLFSWYRRTFQCNDLK